MDNTPGIRRDLALWYARERRDLPWRHIKDPYPIWISEVMLQQTRVETVLPRFDQFLRAFPALHHLAEAPEESVLTLWSGLGYYSRARNLRRGAAFIQERHQGVFPRALPEALAIPGVGVYTAAAVLSIAYGLPHAVVDGNVARVLARLFRLDPPADRSASGLGRLARDLLDPAGPGDHNQAMMELGALVCLPRNPRCPACPLAFACRAHLDGVVSRYPRTKLRPPAVARAVDLLLLRDTRGRLFLERDRWPLLPHLWLPPMADLCEPPVTLRARFQEGRPGLAARVAWSALREADEFRHTITRHKLRIRVHSGLIRPAGGRLPTDSGWFTDEALLEIGRSSILDKALRLDQKRNSALIRCTAGRFRSSV